MGEALMAWVKKWKVVEDTGKKDRHGPILIEAGMLSCGVKMFRRRRERNKRRYMYWCDGGKLYTEHFSDVVAEAQDLAAKGVI
jgi:hypothetical protein